MIKNNDFGMQSTGISQSPTHAPRQANILEHNVVTETKKLDESRVHPVRVCATHYDCHKTAARRPPPAVAYSRSRSQASVHTSVPTWSRPRLIITSSTRAHQPYFIPKSMSRPARTPTPNPNSQSQLPLPVSLPRKQSNGATASRIPPQKRQGRKKVTTH